MSSQFPDKFSVRARVRGCSLFGDLGVRAHCDLMLGQPLLLEREPSNPKDSQAIIVRTILGVPVGYVERRVAATIAPMLDAGVVLLGKIVAVPVFETNTPQGSRLTPAVARIWRDGLMEDDEARAKEEDKRYARPPLSKTPEHEYEDDLVG